MYQVKEQSESLGAGKERNSKLWKRNTFLMLGCKSKGRQIKKLTREVNAAEEKKIKAEADADIFQQEKLNFVKLVKKLADNWKDFQNGNVTRKQRARIESGLHKVYEIIKDNAHELREKGKVYQMKQSLSFARKSNKKLGDENE